MSDDAWMAKAACKGIPDADAIFYPPSKKGVRTDVSKARDICFSTCPVRKTCLVYSVVHRHVYGVWGGFSESERRAIPKDVRRKWRQSWFRVYGRR